MSRLRFTSQQKIVASPKADCMPRKAAAAAIAPLMGTRMRLKSEAPVSQKRDGKCSQKLVGKSHRIWRSAAANGEMPREPHKLRICTVQETKDITCTTDTARAKSPQASVGGSIAASPLLPRCRRRSAAPRPPHSLLNLHVAPRPVPTYIQYCTGHSNGQAARRDELLACTLL